MEFCLIERSIRGVSDRKKNDLFKTGTETILITKTLSRYDE